ncbi:Uncharacterized protein At4g26485 [Linum perenne]
MLFNDRYSRSHRILLVGEGDFSFSASLAVSYGRNASNLVATSLDSLGFLTTNYTKARENIAALRARGCLVIHEMDATKMAGHWFMMGEKFDRIVFNFPFAGYFKEESSGSQIRLVRRHQKLIRMFMKNAKKLMKEDGEVHITHKTNGFHKEWNLEGLAIGVGFRLIGKVKFNFEEYYGYKTKCGFGGDNNFNCNPSCTFKFGLCSSLRRRRDVLIL